MSSFQKYGKRKEIGRKVIDVLTIGHLFTGFLIFTLSYIATGNASLGSSDRYYCAFIVVIVLALAWEFIENFMLMIIKPNGQDSLRNSLTDIVFNLIGGILAWIVIVLMNTFI